MIAHLRTPDDAFDQLMDYPFQPNYHTIADANLRIHYLDEGPKDGEFVLLLHGEPTWSYLYRKMIPVLAEAGFRVIAPDLPGFGKSDKPTQADDITYPNLTKWLSQFIIEKGWNNINVFMQDWGGLLGLRVVADHPHLFNTVMVSNTGFPTGEEKMSDGFATWLSYISITDDWKPGWVVEIGTNVHLSPEEIAAYNAPFPDRTYKQVIFKLPSLVPFKREMEQAVVNKRYWGKIVNLEIPLVCLFSDNDPILGNFEAIFKQCKGAQGMKHHSIPNAYHFVQEDAGVFLSKRMIEFMNSAVLS